MGWNRIFIPMTTLLERGVSDKKDIGVSFDWHVASNEKSFSYFCLRYRDVAVGLLALLRRSFDSWSGDRQYVLGLSFFFLQYLQEILRETLLFTLCLFNCADSVTDSYSCWVNMCKYKFYYCYYLCNYIILLHSVLL